MCLCYSRYKQNFISSLGYTVFKPTVHVHCMCAYTLYSYTNAKPITKYSEQVMATSIAKVVIGSKVKSLTEDVGGMYVHNYAIIATARHSC